MPNRTICINCIKFINTVIAHFFSLCNPFYILFQTDMSPDGGTTMI